MLRKNLMNLKEESNKLSCLLVFKEQVRQLLVQNTLITLSKEDIELLWSAVILSEQELSTNFNKMQLKFDVLSMVILMRLILLKLQMKELKSLKRKNMRSSLLIHQEDTCKKNLYLMKWDKSKMSQSLKKLFSLWTVLLVRH